VNEHDPDILRRNLERLASLDADLAARVASATPAPLQWETARSGALTAALDHAGKPLQLASRYDPAAEAAKLVENVDFARHGGVVVLGLGIGHHVAHLARQMSDNAVMVVFEPSDELLRAVFERIDCTDWLGRANIVLADQQTQRGAMISRIEKFGVHLTQGTMLVTHPPSRQLHGEALAQFGKLVTELLSYCRTTVATALVNAARTVRNLTLNLAHYAAGANTNELYNLAPGVAAVCVGAGPSLAKNVELLRDPQVRSRLIVITAQTTLKPLLDRGIRPDVVTALDYHAISKRFYEDLPPLPDVTLVAEAKANPAILESFPGPIRVTCSGFLQKLLGAMARPIIPIRAGATVAHLSFYVAQHLGCDPIILIGQDLGFSDGLYYAPGTAIHDVWATELGRFNTVEMMEWQRIVRHRVLLHKLQDVRDQPIYSDEQMVTYLKQFERDFDQATQQVIDATEGGLAKRGTVRMTLADALREHAVRPAPKLPQPAQRFDAGRLREVTRLLQQRLDEVRRIRQITQATVPVLQQMLEHQQDARRMAQLFEKLDRNRREVMGIQPAFDLISELNTVGNFRRARADRAIYSKPTDDPFERQRQQLQRDLDNLDWLTQACDEALDIFQQAQQQVGRVHS
jgi:hypothetical protein